MKRCPTCSRVYDDASLRFCFDDGTELINKLPDAGAPETAIMPGSAGGAQATIPAPPPPPPANALAPPFAPTVAFKKKSMLPWVLGAGALLLVLGVAAVSAIILLRPKQALVHHLVLQVPSSAPDRDSAVTQSVTVIRSRLDAYGVSNFEVKPGDPGSGQLLVNLPALKDPERVKQIISAWGKLEFTHVISPPSPQVIQTFTTREEAIASFDNDGNVPENRRVLAYSERDSGAGEAKKWVIVESPSIVDGSELKSATAIRSAASKTDYEIQFSLNKTGADKFGTWTGSHINEYLGIVLDDEVKSIAYIKSQIFDQGEISGRFTKQSAEDLALVLNSGALPGRLEFLEERVDKK
jgi:protein-export membrane protein SecD